MKNNLFKMALIAGLGLAGCQDNQQAIIDNIEKSQKVLYGDGQNFNFDIVKADGLIAAYDKFITKYPNDAKTPEYLFNESEVYSTKKDFDKAIECYTKIYTNYKDHEKAPTALFMLGFTYEDKLKNLVKAKAYYDEFLSKYPQHELADDVQFSLNNLGKSPEEIMKEFEAKMNSQDGNSASTEIKTNETTQPIHAKEKVIAPTGKTPQNPAKPVLGTPSDKVLPKSAKK